MLNGDINQLAQNKLILLYFLSNTAYSFNDENLTNLLLENEIMNYFLIKEYIRELIDSELVKVEEDNTLRVTELGNTSLELFSDKIPAPMMDKLKEALSQYDRNIKFEQEVIADIRENEFGRLVVDLSIIENNQPIFQISLSVSTREEAQDIINNWKANTEDVFMALLKALYNET